MATTTRPRAGTVRSHTWTAYRKRVMPELMARADGLCERCGEPLDLECSPRSRRAPSVDHVHPVAQGGELCPPVSELRLVHVGCNSSRGNRTRRMPAAPIVRRPMVELEPELAEPRAVEYPRDSRASDRRTRESKLAEQMAPLFEPQDFLVRAVTRRRCPRIATQSLLPPPRSMQPSAVDPKACHSWRCCNGDRHKPYSGECAGRLMRAG